MYNSLFFYALKSIKGTPLFSTLYTLFFASMINISFTFIILFNYSNAFNAEISIPIRLIFIIAISLFALLIVAMTLIGTNFIFMQYSRMFSSFLIFGAHKISLMKLILIKMIIFNLLAFIFSIVIIGILYAIFGEYINAALNVNNFFNIIKYYFLSFISIVIINIIVSLISSFIYLLKDSYNIMRSSQ